MNTRFRYDDARTMKHLQQSTDPGRYVLDVPGNGPNPSFMADPHIRAQKWGGNLYTHSTDLESSLLGVNRRSNHDCVQRDEYQRFESVGSQSITSPSSSELTVDQSRTTHPAWTLRDISHRHLVFPLFDPQANLAVPFAHNMSTRIVERDYARPHIQPR